MDLSRLAIPSICEYRISTLCLDNARVLDGLPRELRECLAFDIDASFLGTETILLRIRGIPDPVHEEVAGEEEDEEWCSERI